MYPDPSRRMAIVFGTLSNVPRSGYFTARDQSMVESGVTKGGKNTGSFLFVNEPNKIHNNTNMKSQAKSNDFRSYPRGETAASGGKRCR